MNWPELLIGAVLGAVLGYVFPIVVQRMNRIRRGAALEQRRELMTTPALYDWITKYYQRTGRAGELFDLSTRLGDVQIPVLTSAAWLADFQIGSGHPPLVRDLGPTSARYPVNRRALAARARLGQRLFDAPALSFERLVRNGTRFELETRRCSYFEVATELMGLEEETFAAARRPSRRRKTPIRDSWLGPLNEISNACGRARSVAAAVAVVFTSGPKPCVILQTRSYETVTYGGMQAVIPYFGVVPLAGRSADGGDALDALDVLETNIAKEYCEELFSYDQLVQEALLRNADARWFWSLPEARELRALLDLGEAKLWCLGFGFDGLNGSATMALMLEISQPNFADSMRERVIANWEVADRSRGGESIEFIELESVRLAELLTGKRLTYGSAFAIGRVLQHFKLDVGRVAERPGAG